MHSFDVTYMHLFYTISTLKFNGYTCLLLVTIKILETILRKKKIHRERKRRRCRFIQGHDFGRRFFAFCTK
jgi:hypothetical protein